MLSADEIRRAGIKIEHIETKEYTTALAAFGTIGPNRNGFARVSAPVAGRLVKIAVDVGAQVQAGALLAVLESPELAEARTGYLQNQTELELARLNLERAQKLSTDGSIAQKDLLRTRSDYERARAALSASEARLATLGVAGAAPDGTSPALLAVNAPLAGTVVERTAVLGEYAQAYQALFTVADLSTVWVETNLYDRDLAQVVVGAPASITVSAYPGQRFAGKVTYVGNILDKDTRTAVARVEVANSDGRLRPGLFANVDIETALHRAALRVPENAVVLLQGQMTVFVADDDAFEPRPVEVGDRQNGMVVVTSGLEPGDRVVVSGVYALKARLLKSQIGDSH
ncbi:MAG: efflux RND transporter periplasmic adaptor subunit [Reyranella sp.]|nr:efflux RND transporter periplasmic adaptor subunit [Reyranella sp.]